MVAEGHTDEIVVDVLLVGSVFGVSVPVHHSVEGSTFSRKKGNSCRSRGMIIGTITAQNSIALYTEGAYHLVISLQHAGSHPFQASNNACDRATCRSTT